MIDLSTFIGIPYLERGRCLQGCDCWGIVKIVYSFLWGIELPEYPYSLSDSEKIKTAMNRPDYSWIKTNSPDKKVIAVMATNFKRNNECNHVGLFISKREMIQSTINIGSHIVNIGSDMWMKRIRGYYRYGNDS